MTRGGPAQPYPAADVPPYDPELEAELVGALAANGHVGPPPDPADFYIRGLALIARAFLEHRDRLGAYAYAWITRSDDELTFVITIEGLPEVLAELGDRDPRRSAHLAGILAATAHLTGPQEVERLHALAEARRRLHALEEERAEIKDAIRSL